MSEEIVIKGKRFSSADRVRADRTDKLYEHIPEGEPLVKIENLNVTYRTDEKTTVAVDNLSFNIMKGELVAIVGPSGCGKSTILRCISGLLQPTSGTIMIGDKECTTAGSDRGMVFQDFALFPWRSVRQNVEFGLEIAGVPKEERHERSERYLKAMGLQEFADARVHELSGGMKQRVGIARAMIMHPAVILMDEPFGALDAQTRNILQESLVKVLKNSPRTIVFVTHSVDEALYLADRVLILSKRPATIHAILEVPGERPRERTSPEFIQMRQEILSYLQSQNTLRFANVFHGALRAPFSLLYVSFNYAYPDSVPITMSDECTVTVMAGVCAMTTKIHAKMNDDMSVTLEIETDCPQIKKGLEAEPIPVGMPWDEVGTPMIESGIYKWASEHLRHTACPVPCCVIKAIEAAGGLGLKKDPVIKIERASSTIMPAPSRPPDAPIVAWTAPFRISSKNPFLYPIF
ncbi:MAG: ABC transporter ATP-binding protein [Candidatus Methanomethylophilaceae archaeon]|nr:ABC transporter ATP-binding protein [Candidatus Methanomethylophilaceae archaeon]